MRRKSPEMLRVKLYDVTPAICLKCVLNVVSRVNWPLFTFCDEFEDE
jgi:hypothetical protein